MNIKTLFMTAAAITLMVSCGLGKKYTVNGELGMPEFEGQTAYLYIVDDGTLADSTVIRDGKFTFKGQAESLHMGRIVATDSLGMTSCQGYLVLEPGKIYIDLVSDSLSGTPMNDEYFKAFSADETTRQLHAQAQAIIARASTTPQEGMPALAAEYEVIDSRLNAHKVELARTVYANNSDNVLGAYALSEIVEYDGITFDSLDMILKSASPAVANYTPLRVARTQLFHLDNTAVGKKYVDLSGINFANGRTVKLSSMIQPDEITLIDFWASWCGPCRREIADNLVPLYKKYKDKGVNIIGVDVRDRMENHKAAVEELGITYPQLIDTTSNALESYAIQGIPQILLIGRDGTILQRDLRGAAIETAIIEALKN